MKNYVELTRRMLAIDESENTNFIRIDIPVPQKIKDLYNRVYQYFYDGLIEYKETLEETELFVRIINYKSDSEEETIEKKQGTFESNLEDYLRDHIKIAGGSISDLVINHYLSHDHDTKDIDIFIDNFLFNSAAMIIGNGRFFNENNPFTYDNLEEVTTYMINSIFSNESKEDAEQSRWQFDSYTHERIKQVHKVVYQDSRIDIVLQSFVGKEQPDVIPSFDFFFRGFSYDGLSIRGTQRGLNDIRNQTIAFQNLNSPTSSLVRSLAFKKRYNFKMVKREKLLAMNELFWDSAYFLDNAFKAYQTNEEARFESATAMTSARIDFVNNSMQTFKKHLSSYNRKVTKEEFFVAFQKSYFENILRYEDWMDIEITEDLEHFYRFYEQTDNLKLAYILRKITPDYIGDRKYKLDFFLDHNLHELEDQSIDINDFPMDYDDIIQSGKYYEGEGGLNHEFFDGIEDLVDSYNLQKTFNPNIHFIHYLDGIDTYDHQKFPSSGALRFLIDAQRFNVLKQTGRLTKESVSSWYNHCLSQSIITILGICSDTINARIEISREFLRNGGLSVQVRYGDTYNLVPKKFLANGEDWKSSYLYFFFTDTSLDDRPQFQYGMEMTESYVHMNIQRDGLRINHIQNEHFLFLNGKRFVRFENEMKLMLSNNRTLITN